jgi:hypothetical protein
VKSEKYCEYKNEDLNIENPRLVLLENIRQSCIYTMDGIDIYWNYMKTFSDICISLTSPNFNQECAISVMNKVGSNKSKVNDCMQNTIESKVNVLNNRTWKN